MKLASRSLKTLTAPCWLAATHYCCSVIWFFFVVFLFYQLIFFFNLFVSLLVFSAVVVSQEPRAEPRIWAAEAQSAESPLLISDLVSTVNHRRHLQGMITHHSSKYSYSGFNGLHLAASGTPEERKPTASWLLNVFGKTKRINVYFY